MQESERDFLLAEYEQAWTMVQLIDERRFKFVEYYTAVFTVIVAFASVLVTWRGTIDLAVAIPLTVLLGLGALFGLTFRKMMLSERQGNVRYRRKINLLRAVFLERSDDPVIAEYLTHKDIGILLPSDPQPIGIGSTLTWVMRFMALETATLGMCIAGVWIAYFIVR